MFGRWVGMKLPNVKGGHIIKISENDCKVIFFNIIMEKKPDNL